MPAWRIVGNGMQGASGSEDILYWAGAPGGQYVLWVDLINMLAGDSVIIRARYSVDGTNFQLSEQATFAGSTNAVGSVCTNIVDMVMGTPSNIQFTLQQTAGGNRSYQWQVLLADDLRTLMGQICI
jgi:hypothetical protein